VGEADMGPNPSPQELAALRFVVQEQKDQISANRRILEQRRDEADASSRRWAKRSSHYSSSVQHRTRSHIQPGADMHKSPEIWKQTLVKQICYPRPRKLRSWKQQCILL
jgi:hypothetical protein